MNRELIYQFRETMERASRLANEILRDAARDEEELEQEVEWNEKQKERMRREHEKALQEREHWQKELDALERRFGKEFDALSPKDQEATAKRVILLERDFRKWREEPLNPVYRYELLVGLLKEDAIDEPAEGVRRSTG